MIQRLAGIAGVDILLAASSVSRSSTSGLATVEAPATSLGYGLRVGLAQTRKTPALALTSFTHNPRRYELNALTDDGMMDVSNMQVRATSLNVSMGYRWRRAGFAAGIGQVTADAEATVRGTRDGFSSPAVSVWYVASTTNAFIDGTLKVGPAHLVVGVGRTGRMTDEYGWGPGYNIQFSPNEGPSTVFTLGTRIGG